MLIYFDMDGVLSDFDKHFMEIYGRPIDEMNLEEQVKFWEEDCVNDKFFITAPTIEEGFILYNSLNGLGYDIAILSSTGGGKQHTEIAKQKLDFLNMYGLGHLPVAFAAETQSKASFASPNHILIDDRMKVVLAFGEKGHSYLFEKSKWKEILESIVLTYPKVCV